MAPLTPAAALAEVLARLGASPSRSVVLSGAELQGWPADAVAVLKAHGVLRPGKPGETAVCPGCEAAGVMPVQERVRAGRPAAVFIVCDKRDDINRVPLDGAHLERWRADGRTLGDALAVLLGGSECQPVPADAQALRLGVVSGRADKAAVHLRFDRSGRVLLDVAGHGLELGLVLAVEGDRLVLDTRHLARCLDAPVGGTALTAETAEQRTDRLLARRDVLKRRGEKAFLKVIAQEEGLSVSMVKKILGRALPAPAAPLPGWVAPLAPRQGVSPGKKSKR